jgi:hypothetical protein
MKVVVAKYLAKTPLLPPIPLVRDDEKEYAKGSYMSMKLRSTPADEHSPTHEIQVPYFKSGTCEQFLDFLDKVSAVFHGQNLTTGPQKVAFMRTVLKGDALSNFSQYFITAGNEDSATFDLAVKSLITHIFPLRALRIQKRYMRRYMRKPRDMKMRTYRNRVVELNNYLAKFPSDFSDAQKIDDEEIVDILEFGTPNKWQYEMVRLGFDSATATSQALVEFCERLEFTEELAGGNNDQNEAKPKTGPSGGRPGRSYAPPKSSRSGAPYQKNPNNSFNKRQKVDTVAHHQGSYDSEKYCTLHGMYGHDLNNCKVMLDQANKMRAAWQTASGGGGQNDRLYKKKSQEKDLHTLVQKMVQGEMQHQKLHSKKRKAGNVHFVDDGSTAKAPSKTDEENEDDEDTDIDFGSLNLKSPESDESESDGDLYA